MYNPANRFSSTGEAALINGSRINQGGLVNRTHSASRQPRVIIIGAGMSGLCMGIKLLEAGNDNFRIYEKAARVGGTWRENTTRTSPATCRRIAMPIPSRRIRNGTGAMVAARKSSAISSAASASLA